MGNKTSDKTRGVKLRRLILSACLVIVWAPLGGWLFFKKDEIQKSAEIEQVNSALASEDPAWRREHVFILNEDLQVARRQGRPLLESSGGGEEHLNPERIRILAIGDSYAEGVGLFNDNDRWWVVLQDELNSLHGEGVFEVVGLGDSGASAFSYAQWVERIKNKDYQGLSKNSEESEKVFEKPFDFIIIGHLGNDVIAREGDGVKGAGSIPYGEHDEITEGGRENPFLEDYKKVPERIREASQGAELYWMPMEPQTTRDPLFKYWENHGFEYVETPNSLKLKNEHERVDLMVHPKDRHPNAALYYTYGKDAAESISKKVDKERLQKAIGEKQPIKTNLISSYKPHTLEFKEGGVIFYSGEADPSTCSGYQREGVEMVCENDKIGYKMDGAEIPAQFVSCSNLGRPHLQIGFDRLHKGTIKIEILKTKRFETEIDLYAYGYDKDRFIVVKPLGSLRAGESLKVGLGPAVRGVFLAERGKNTCDYKTAEEGNLNRFEFEITQK